MTSAALAAAESDVPGDRGAGTGHRSAHLVRVIRFVVACGVSAGVCDAVWHRVPDKLAVTTDVVGYPVFADFDYSRYFDAYYLVAFVFPLLALLVYHLLAWRGPLRKPRDDRPMVPAPLAERPAQQPPPATPGRRGRGVLDQLVAVTVGLVLPAVTVAIEISSSRAFGAAVPTGAGLVAGVAYLIAVVGASALAVAVVTRRRAGVGAGHGRTGPDSTGVTATVRAAFALSVVPLLLFVSRSTGVSIGSDHRVVSYPWLPVWLVVAVTAGLVWWFGRRLVRGGTPARVESSVMTFVVGPVLLYLAVAHLPGALGPFAGFDDAQGLVGAQLTFHGYFPWKDLFFIHGLLADVFDDGIGMAVFSNTRWGADAGATVLVAPLTIVILYLFSAYYARRNRIFLLGVSAAIVLGILGPFADRFAFAPLLLILFDVVVRRRSRVWCAVLMGTLIVESIITPEVGLLAVGLIVTLVAFEWVHRRRGEALSTAFFRTRWCFVFGVVFTAAWVVFLAATGALAGFIDYYRIFGPGHTLSGAIPAQWSFLHQPAETAEFVLAPVLVMLTFWRVVAKLRGRHPWRPLDWSMVCAATWAAVYFGKALARADQGHVGEAVTVTMPLLLLWAVVLLGVVDRFLARLWTRLKSSSFTPRRIASLAAVVAVVALAPESLSTLRVNAADFRASVSGPATITRFGYAVPGAVNPDKLIDLAAVFERYAGPRAKIFDFSNDPGIVYYLLGRQPATRFSNVSMAVPPDAQQMLVSDLERNRPPVVVFDDDANGLPEWDGIENMVRHYVVSQYILDHYVPLVDADGTLVMLRSDLARPAAPLPALRGPSLTSDLYFDAPTCSWGDLPDFLQVPGEPAPGAGRRVTTRVVARGLTTMSGWAVDRTQRRPAREVVAVSGGQVVGTAPVSTPRPDVAAALKTGAVTDSGFTLVLPRLHRPVQLYGLNSDGTLSPLGVGAGASGSVVTPGTARTVVSGHVVHPVRSGPVVGFVDVAVTSAREQVASLSLPRGTDLGAYRWLQLTSTKALASGQVTITDELGVPSHEITFNVLAARTHVAVQVGSCQQWHGYQSSNLMLLERVGEAVPTVRLAG